MISKKISTVRASIINCMIDSNKRPDTGFKSKKLFNCDVCWNCKFFKIEQEKCILSYDDAELVMQLPYQKEYFTNIHIRKPTWFRCMWWREPEIK